MSEVGFLPKSEFDRVTQAGLAKRDFLPLIARMCRFNTLVNVKKAGSGHLGSSFSAMDVVIYFYYDYLNTARLGFDHPDRDIYFSSKGHDVPGLYAVLYSLGVIPEERYLKLRRLNGLDGHPDIRVPGIEANTGSLGMGISKGRGMVWGKKRLGRKGKVIVLTGDGEWQEGQNFEALQSTVSQKVNDLIVVMDHNKLQSDRLVDEIVSLGDLEAKFRAFGWHVARCDGHDYGKLEAVFREFEGVTDRPKILIADTIKGRGVSFMEHPTALKENGGRFKWHAGAPDDESFRRAYDELLSGVAAEFVRHGLGQPKLRPVELPQKGKSGVSPEFVAEAYGKALVGLAEKNDKFVVLDGDLSLDCKLVEFEKRYRDRFIEVGIAEQDMVSMAAGLASQGFLPIVNTFANFLAARTNEQLYNNFTEKRKIIYACHYAGLIPAGPGKSHQAVRDISLFGAFPGCTIMQPCNSAETKLLTEYAVLESPESCMIRFAIGPSPRIIELPAGYRARKGVGVALTEGRDAILMAYGPVMMNEALIASELLVKDGIGLRVINMPWLNRFDGDWLDGELKGIHKLFVLEDHAPFGGLGDHLTDFLNQRGMLGKVSIAKFGVEGIAECGTPAEALGVHRLDGQSVAARIRERL